MPEVPDPVLRFAGGLANAAGLILIALGGLCACGTGIMAEEGATEPAAWLVPFAFLVPGVLIIFLGAWLRDRSRTKRRSPPT